MMMKMVKKLLITVLFTTIALATLGAPLLAADQLTAAEKKRLFREGAKLWPLYCNTCHNARPGSEKAPYEWNQIMMHMQTLGNIPPQDAQALIEYLKAR